MEIVNSILMLTVYIVVASIPTALCFAFWYALDHAGK